MPGGSESGLKSQDITDCGLKQSLQLSLPLDLHQLHLKHENKSRSVKGTINEQNKQKDANLKDENRVSRDLWWTAAGAVAKLRRDDQLPLLSFTHPNLGFNSVVKFLRSCCKPNSPVLGPSP